MKTKSDFLVLLTSRERERLITKPVRRFFNKLYGVGKHRQKVLMAFIGINKNYSLRLVKFKNRLKYRLIDRFLTRSNLVYGYTLKRRRFLLLSILKNLYTYKGMRRSFGKPCRGQRTRTNAATAKRFSFGMSSKLATGVKKKYSKDRIQKK